MLLTAASWIATHLPPQLCRSAKSTWTDPVWKPPLAHILGDSVHGVWLWAVLAVFGNLLVMTAILHFKQLHSPTSFLIASLACADFLMWVTVMPFSMVRSVESCWYFGWTLCAFHMCCDVALCYSSLFHLSFISIDRSIAVTDPRSIPPSLRCLRQGRASASPGSCPRVKQSCVPHRCSWEWDGGISKCSQLHWTLSACYKSILDFDRLYIIFVPTFVMIILYSNIFLVARQQAIKIEQIPSKVEELSAVYKTRVTEREKLLKL